MMTLGDPGAQGANKNAFNRRLEDVGWALFLIMIGTLLLVPDEQIPQGTWLVGTGVIMLGINAVRYLNGIRVNGFTIVLGALALAAGLGDLLGVTLPLFALFLILMGASLILKPLVERKA